MNFNLSEWFDPLDLTETPRDLARKIQIKSGLDREIIDEVTEAFEIEKLKNNVILTDLEKHQRIQTLLELYEKNIECYAKRKITFGFAYDYLVNSADASMLRGLIELERNYAKITKLIYEEMIQNASFSVYCVLF